MEGTSGRQVGQLGGGDGLWRGSCSWRN